MNRFFAFGAALVAASVLPALPIHAAEADEDEKKVATDQIAHTGTRLAQPEVAPASDEATQALRRLKLPSGLVAKLWAAEPMLANPVAFNFDERGRIFVAESHRYVTSAIDVHAHPWIREDDLASRTIEDRLAIVRKYFGFAGEKELSIETEVVRLLVDTDGDGIADKSHVYADGFNSPLDGAASGVLARRGQVWLTNIPSLWKFTGDTRAATRTEISRGYGVRFHYNGHDLHGLVLGPDGKIYFSNGDRGATIKTKEGTVISSPDEGAVFRCNPDGSQLELVMGGLRNPQSLVFNEYGDLFTGDNDGDQDDEERLMHIVEGGDGGWRVGYQFPPRGRGNPWLAERLWQPRHPGQAAYLVPPICNIEDGPSGIDYYPGTGLNADYRGRLFITHFKGAVARSGIDTYTLKPKGASYEVTDTEPFLSSALPTDVKFGPDGRLYYSDWAEGWTKSKRGRIYAISDPKRENDPLIKETKALIGGDWTRRTANELAKLLAHPDWRVRLEAQFTLAERGAASITTLAKVATTTSAHALARRHAVWGLGQLAASDKAALAPVRTLLRDSDSEVRAQALKVLGDARLASDGDSFIVALTNANNRVMFFAAQGLAKLEHAAAAPALLATLRANDNKDHTLRHALVLALAAGHNTAVLSAAVTDKSPAVRLGVLLALRRIGHADAAKFLADPDPLIAREAALAINDAPIAAAFTALAALLPAGDAAPSPRILADEPVGLRAINAHFRLGAPANAAVLAQFAARADVSAALRAEALAQLALWPKPPQRDRLVGVFRPLAPAARDRAVAADALRPHLAGLLAASSPAAVQTATLAAMQALEIAGATEALFATVKNDALPAETRAAALVTLDKIKDARLGEAVAFASASAASALRVAALPIAARLSPETAAPAIANLAAKGSLEEQKAALRSLGLIRHPSADALLAEQLNLLAAGKIPAPVQLDLLSAAGRRDSPEIKALLEKRTATLAASSDPLAPHRVALEGGSASRGEQVFRNQPVLACIRCHRVGGEGGDAGPNLAGIGVKQSREYLLEAIVKPNAKIAPGFDTLVVTLKSGGIIAGIVASETSSLLTLRTTDNKTVEVKKTDIAKREGAPSGMPEIYGTILTPSELRDVVEYMASLRPTRLRDRLPQGMLRDAADYLLDLKQSLPFGDKKKPRALRDPPPPQVIIK